MTLFERGLAGEPLDCFVFDAHTHVGPRCEIDRDVTPERFLAQMDRIGIDVACMMAFTPSAGATLDRHNEYVRRFVSTCPDRLKGYCWVNPNYPDQVDGELKRCFDEWGFLGIKVHTHPKHPYDGDRWAPVYEFANERGLPVLAHTWGDDWLKQFASMARKYPNANFIAAHTGGGNMQINIDEANRTQNLYLDVVLSMGTPWEVERLVREVGASKLIWGSDEILISSAHQIGRVIFADISEDDKRLILGGNARRCFGI
jgi:predicted TIM-barrel fold metal-dependent hydrolase